MLSADFVSLEIGLRLSLRVMLCYMIYHRSRDPLLDRLIQRGRTRCPWKRPYAHDPRFTAAYFSQITTGFS